MAAADHQPAPAYSPEQVAAVLAQLRSEIQARRATLAQQDAASSTLSELERQLQQAAEQLEITRVVSAHWPLESTNLVQRGVFLIHKLVRRGLRWYINPIVEQQNAFNETATRTLRLLIEAHAELRRDLQVLAEPPTPPSDPAPAAPTPPSDPATPTAAVQQWVEQRAAQEPPAHLSELRLAPLTAQLALRQDVNAHWLIVGNSAVEQLAAYTARLIRLYLRWLINPLVEQQNSFNAALTGAAQTMQRSTRELRAVLAARRARR